MTERLLLFKELSSEKPDINTITSLIQAGINLNSENNKKSPLHYAILLPKNKKRNQIVKLLLEHGADICIKGKDISSPRDGYLGEISSLEFIIHQGLEEVLDICIAHGCQLDVPELVNWFPFEKEKRGNLKFLEKLLSLRISLTKDEMYRLLKGAIDNNRDELLSYLLSLNPDLNYHPFKPLIHLVKYSTPVLIMLLKGGADPNVYDNMGFAALHRPAPINDSEQKHRIDTILKYSQVHVNINIQSIKGSFPSDDIIEGITPIALYCRYSNNYFYETISYLVEKGADTNIKDIEFGNTALHYAIKSRSYKTAGLLLSSGANSNIKNKKGKTPIELIEDESEREQVKQQLAI